MPAVTFPAAEHHHSLTGTKLYCLMTGKIQYVVSVWVIANTAGSIISLTTVKSIAYLASPDSSDSLGIIIYFFLPSELSGGQGSEWVKKEYSSLG